MFRGPGKTGTYAEPPVFLPHPFPHTHHGTPRPERPERSPLRHGYIEACLLPRPCGGWHIIVSQTNQPSTMPTRHAPTIFMSSPPPAEVFNIRVYLIALVASMGAFIFGYDLAFIGTTITLEPFVNDFGLAGASEARTDAFSANVVSLLQAGCFFGSLAVAPLGDKYGRKPALMVAGVIFCIGSITQTASQGMIAVMFTGRFVGGLVCHLFVVDSPSRLTFLSGSRVG